MRVPNRQGVRKKICYIIYIKYIFVFIIYCLFNFVCFQQELSNGTGNMSRNQSVNPTANKVNVKQNYSQGATPYWNSN